MLIRKKGIKNNSKDILITSVKAFLKLSDAANDVKVEEQLYSYIKYARQVFSVVYNSTQIDAIVMWLYEINKIFAINEYDYKRKANEIALIAARAGLTLNSLAEYSN